VKIPHAAIVSIAMVCHEANKAWCAVNGDPSQRGWRESQEWQRLQAIRGVGYLVSHPDAPESALHDNWVADMVSSGWSLGPVKNPVLQTHPNIVPFELLPPVQQAKDKLFAAIVKALLPVEDAQP